METKKKQTDMNNIQDRGDLLRGMQTSQHTLLLTFGMSALCHTIFFAILIFMPQHSPAKKFVPSVINISMVTPADILLHEAKRLDGAPQQEMIAPPFPQKNPEAEINAPIPKKMPKVEPKPKNIPAIAQVKPPEPVSIPKKMPKVEPKPKKKPKIVDVPPEKQPVEPKKEVPKPSNSVKKAIKQLQKSIEQTKPDPVKSALNKIKQQVAEKERQGGGYGLNYGAFEQYGPGDYNNPRIQLYSQEMKYHIKRYWAFSRQLAGLHDDLETQLLIRIGRDGRIITIDFKQKSGNNYLDESAYKAVQKSNPLPRLPGEYHTLAFVVRFTPSGLN
jgi:colicin import membrane protein